MLHRPFPPKGCQVCWSPGLGWWEWEGSGWVDMPELPLWSGGKSKSRAGQEAVSMLPPSPLMAWSPPAKLRVPKSWLA